MTETELDERTALVVVDVQNDFAHPDGSLYVREGERVIPGINDLIREVRAAGGLVVYTQDWHPPETPHFVTSGGTWPVHCVRDTWGAQLHDELTVDGPIVRKGTGGEDGYSGFTVRDGGTDEERPTELAELLREHEIERVIVAGLAQDVCVRATAIDAVSLGFEATVPLELTRAVNVNEGDDERANAEMEAAGVALG
mgnify:CR=1 FL=1